MSPAHRLFASTFRPTLFAIALLFAFAGAYAAEPRAPQQQHSVILASLDGLAYRIFADDPAAKEMRALRRIVARGVQAKGMVQSFPSVTPAGHAAVWTGAFGDTTGIITASNPVLPRSEHTILERQSGFNPGRLRAEPLWVTAARQGVSVVGNELTQNYPFDSSITGGLARNQPVLVSGYGPDTLEPYGFIRADKTHAEDAAQWQPPLPRSALPVKAFSWKVNSVQLHGALVADKGKARGYTAMYVAADTTGRRVRVAFAPTEHVPPRDRALARHFSAELHLSVNGVPTVGYFRLFELARDGSDFFLMQTPMHQLAMYDGKDGGAAGLALLNEAGGFIGNGPGYKYQEGNLGKPLFEGGDGTAERRYLEAMELLVRQSNRHTRWLWKKYSPQLLIDYSPYPDEMEHTWYGLARPDVTGSDAGIAKRIFAYRKWGYAVLDTRVALLDSLAGSKGHIVFVSDHGMAPVAKDVNVNLALKNAGLQADNGNGGMDLASTLAVHNKYGVMINTTDWRNGIVAPADHVAAVDRVEAVLAAIRDPDTGKPVVSGFVRPGNADAPPGIGGSAGADIYFDLAQGYAASDHFSKQVVTAKRSPRGEHGFFSTRDDMLAVFIARGPRLPQGSTIPTIQSIDVASVICDLLGIDPPAQNRGKSPFLNLRPPSITRATP